MTRSSRPLPRADAQFWEERHTRYSPRAVYPRPQLYHLDATLARFFRRHLSARRGQRLLEVGCGSSVWLPYFSRELGLQVSGLDLSPVGLENARRVLAAGDAAAELFQGDLFAPDTGLENRFHIVFSLGLLEHFSDPVAVLEALCRFLAAGGLVLTWVPNTSGRIVALSQRLNPALAEFYVPLNRETVVDLHRQAGLTVLEARYCQLLDSSLVNLERFSPFWRTALARLGRLISLPFLHLERLSNRAVQSPQWCSGIQVAACRKAE